jgi:Ig-like domain from next to BRCA1 gene/Transglycosylase SLT domain
MRRRRACQIAVLVLLVPLQMAQAGEASACSQPGTWPVAAAFELASNNILPSGYPQANAGSGVTTVPSSLLKAIGWVESGWRQYTQSGRPLVSFDFGYGIMQITSGMAGSFGNVSGDIDPVVQAKIASIYRFNIAYGQTILIKKWESTPRIGNGDPTILENWYYAVWAYNGWGWVNNPGNPRFTRAGTPATHPGNFPYQERVLYLVAHPPRDANGNPLWRPVTITLPTPQQIGPNPREFTPTHEHRQPVATISAIYTPRPLGNLITNAVAGTSVKITNTGSTSWLSTGPTAVALTYHIMTLAGRPWNSTLSPFAPGIIAFGQGARPLPMDILPGQSVTVAMSITAPATPGAYRIVWDLQLGSSTWFSQLGVLPLSQTLRASAPNLLPTVTPTPSATPALKPVVGLQYVADTSVPDGTIVPAGSHFLKGWLVYNNGRRNWAHLTLHLTSGVPLGARAISLPDLHVCRTTNLVVPMTAPRKSGNYQSVWRLRDVQGSSIGDPLTVVIRVTRGSPGPTPIPTFASTPTPPVPNPTHTPVG